MQTKEEIKLKRQEYYKRRRDYYMAQNKEWRDNHKPDRKAHAAAKHIERKLNNPALYLLKYARSRAKHDNLDFSIILEDIVIPEVCPYLGTPIQMFNRQYAASLDRIDSSRGYTKDNIQVISYLANRMKSNATEEQLLAFAKGVLAVHSKEVGCADIL